MKPWNIPNEEAILTRIEELETFLEHFPESPLAPVFLEAIRNLEEQLP